MLKNLFEWASTGSNDKVIDDLVGDQNGREVKIGEYYNFDQKMRQVERNSIKETWLENLVMLS